MKYKVDFEKLARFLVMEGDLIFLHIGGYDHGETCLLAAILTDSITPQTIQLAQELSEYPDTSDFVRMLAGGNPDNIPSLREEIINLELRHDVRLKDLFTEDDDDDHLNIPTPA